MNPSAPKCPSCKRAFHPTKISQVYCSAKCRQRAYRKRKRQNAAPQKPRRAPPLLVLPCHHCLGTFWATRPDARFCSTSCRTLYHRALRDSIPQALTDAYGLPPAQAADIVDTQPLAAIRQLLAARGYRYDHQERAWTHTDARA